MVIVRSNSGSGSNDNSDSNELLDDLVAEADGGSWAGLNLYEEFTKLARD